VTRNLSSPASGEVAARRGLNSAEAAARLARDGFNEIESAHRRSFLTIALGALREPMIALLAVSGGVYMALGDRGQGALLLLFIVAVVAIQLVQVRKSDRALQHLKSLASPRALVIRDGARQRIPGREVVRGDTLIVGEGDRVPADCWLLDGRGITVDESMLTGESLAVEKHAASFEQDEIESRAPPRPDGDCGSYLFSSTLVVAGQGIALAARTGAHAEFGRIGASLAGVEALPTRLQRETRRLVVLCAILGVVASLVLTTLIGLRHGDWLQAFLSGLTLTIALLPEEFPIVLTIFLALGALRLTRVNVLTREMSAIETLGSATVLCVDKTGTLTMNRMRVAAIVPAGDNLAGDETPAPLQLLRHAALASRREAIDPMETAIHAALREESDTAFAATGTMELIREYPLSPSLRALTRVWRAVNADNGKAHLMVAAKGAPEDMLRLCRIEGAALEVWHAEVDRLAAQGLRVLGVAGAIRDDGIDAMPDAVTAFTFHWLGLVALADPLRAEAGPAVRECVAAGLKVVMITGDHPQTARAIGREIGIVAAGNGAATDAVLTGAQIAGFDEAQLRDAARRVAIFCRVAPEQKLRIVRALQANREVVAMTGDGINDAPALKAADIGIAMGGRGTDVAREAADLVLVNDDFQSIVNAIRQGRRIFDNLRKAFAFVVSVHIPVVGLALIPALLGAPALLFPIHVVMLQFIIDPACAIAFEVEREEEDTMRRPPRGHGEALLDLRTLAVAALQGLSVLAAVFAVYAWSHAAGHSTGVTRSLAFTALTAGNVALILFNRSWTRTFLRTLGTPNHAALLVGFGALTALAIALWVPAASSLFRFERPAFADVGVALAAGFCALLWFEILKSAGGRGGRGRRRQV
jgi:P-type Ca2+ transporter type 2C